MLFCLVGFSLLLKEELSSKSNENLVVIEIKREPRCHRNQTRTSLSSKSNENLVVIEIKREPRCHRNQTRTSLSSKSNENLVVIEIKREPRCPRNQTRTSLSSKLNENLVVSLAFLALIRFCFIVLMAYQPKKPFLQTKNLFFNQKIFSSTKKTFFNKFKNLHNAKKV